MLTCTSFWMSLFRSVVKSALMERMAEFFCTEIGVLSSLKVKRGFFSNIWVKGTGKIYFIV